MKNQEKSVRPLVFESCMQFIRNGIGSNQYRNFFASVDDKKQDILKDGELSCAYFVSSVLHQFLLIDRAHATVAGTIEAVHEAGWQKIEKEKAGCLLVWEEKDFDGERHAHIGFFLGDDQAVSNSAVEKVPIQHHWKFVGSTFGERKVTSKYWHPRLGE